MAALSGEVCQHVSECVVFVTENPRYVFEKNPLQTIDLAHPLGEPYELKRKLPSAVIGAAALAGQRECLARWAALKEIDWAERTQVVV